MITLTIQPTKVFLSAYRPIVFTATSDRYANTQLTSVVVSDNGSGKCRFTKATHGLKSGDLFTCSAGAVDDYEVTHYITALTSGTFDSQIDYVAPDTVTVDRNNANFQLKADIYLFDSARVTIASVTDAGGGDITVNTGSAHGYSSGDIISVEETTNYNNAHKVVSVGSPTSFNITQSYVATDTGYTRKGTIKATKIQRVGVAFSFDVSGVIESQLSYNIEALTGASPRIVNQNDASCKHFALVITEQHDDINGLLTSFDDILSKKKIGINAALQHEETQDFDNYLITATASTTKKFLTDSPRSIYVKNDKWVQISFLFDGNQNIKVRLRRYLSGLYSDDDSANYQIVGKRGIIMVKLPTAYDYSQIFLINASNQQISEKITVYPDTYCEGVKAWFMNRKGGFDTYEFTGMLFKSSKNEKESYLKQLSTGFAKSDRGLTNIHVNSDSNYTVYGQYESPAVIDWLDQLFSSPEIYIEDAASNLIPVNSDNNENEVINPEEPLQPVFNYVKSNKTVIQ